LDEFSIFDCSDYILGVITIKAVAD